MKYLRLRFFLYFILLYVLAINLDETYVTHEIRDFEDHFLSLTKNTRTQDYSKIDLTNLERHYKIHTWLDILSGLPIFKNNSARLAHRLYNLKGKIALYQDDMPLSKEALLQSVPNQKLENVYWLKFDLACSLIDAKQSSVVLEFLEIIQSNYHIGYDFLLCELH